LVRDKYLGSESDWELLGFTIRAVSYYYFEAPLGFASFISSSIAFLAG